MTATVSAGRPAPPRANWGACLLMGAAAVLTVAAGGLIEFELKPLFTDTGRGWFIIREFLAPDWAFLLKTADAWLETLSIAIIASLVGGFLALVVSLLASDVTADRVVRRIARSVLAVLRSLPDVAWGMLGVAFLGVGATAGTFALVMFSLGIVAKLTGETIDAVDRRPVEAAHAAGANVVQRAWLVVVPQVLPAFFSYAMYAFELNVRASVVLGFVGAGGIGSTILIQLGRFNYDNLAAVIVALFVVVFLIDTASRLIRRRLIG